MAFGTDKPPSNYALEDAIETVASPHATKESCQEVTAANYSKAVPDVSVDLPASPVSIATTSTNTLVDSGLMEQLSRVPPTLQPAPAISGAPTANLMEQLSQVPPTLQPAPAINGVPAAKPVKAEAASAAATSSTETANQQEFIILQPMSEMDQTTTEDPEQSIMLTEEQLMSLVSSGSQVVSSEGLPSAQKSATGITPMHGKLHDKDKSAVKAVHSDGSQRHDTLQTSLAAATAASSAESSRHTVSVSSSGIQVISQELTIPKGAAVSPSTCRVVPDSKSSGGKNPHSSLLPRMVQNASAGAISDLSPIVKEQATQFVIQQPKSVATSVPSETVTPAVSQSNVICLSPDLLSQLQEKPGHQLQLLIPAGHQLQVSDLGELQIAAPPAQKPQKRGAQSRRGLNPLPPALRQGQLQGVRLPQHGALDTLATAATASVKTHQPPKQRPHRPKERGGTLFRNTRPSAKSGSNAEKRKLDSKEMYPGALKQQTVPCHGTWGAPIQMPSMQAPDFSVQAQPLHVIPTVIPGQEASVSSRSLLKSNTALHQTHRAGAESTVVVQANEVSHDAATTQASSMVLSEDGQGAVHLMYEGLEQALLEAGLPSDCVIQTVSEEEAIAIMQAQQQQQQAQHFIQIEEAPNSISTEEPSKSSDALMQHMEHATLDDTKPELPNVSTVQPSESSDALTQHVEYAMLSNIKPELVNTSAIQPSESSDALKQHVAYAIPDDSKQELQQLVVGMEAQQSVDSVQRKFEQLESAISDGVEILVEEADTPPALDNNTAMMEGYLESVKTEPETAISVKNDIVENPETMHAEQQDSIQRMGDSHFAEVVGSQNLELQVSGELGQEIIKLEAPALPEHAAQQDQSQVVMESADGSQAIKQELTTSTADDPGVIVQEVWQLQGENGEGTYQFVSGAEGEMQVIISDGIPQLVSTAPQSTTAADKDMTSPSMVSATDGDIKQEEHGMQNGSEVQVIASATGKGSASSTANIGKDPLPATGEHSHEASQDIPTLQHIINLPPGLVLDQSNKDLLQTALDQCDIQSPEFSELFAQVAETITQQSALTSEAATAKPHTLESKVEDALGAVQTEAVQQCGGVPHTFSAITEEECVLDPFLVENQRQPEAYSQGLDSQGSSGQGSQEGNKK